MDPFLKGVGEQVQGCNCSSEIIRESLPVIGKKGYLINNPTVGHKVVELCVELTHAPGGLHLVVLEGVDCLLHLVEWCKCLPEVILKLLPGGWETVPDPVNESLFPILDIFSFHIQEGCGNMRSVCKVLLGFTFKEEIELVEELFQLGLSSVKDIRGVDLSFASR